MKREERVWERLEKRGKPVLLPRNPAIHLFAEVRERGEIARTHGSPRSWSSSGSRRRRIHKEPSVESGSPVKRLMLVETLKVRNHSGWTRGVA